MKYTALCALVATISAIRLENRDIDMDPAHDAAYFPTHNTGNYTYSIKPNEYRGWNGGYFTHNQDSTGGHMGAFRVPDHRDPEWEMGHDSNSNGIKTEYGSHPHTAQP